MNEAQDTQAQVLLDSNMFTQVEHDWLVDSDNRRTFINRRRGVIATQTPNMGDHTHFAFDKGEQTYYSGGWYDSDEITQYILPLMRDDEAWRRFTEHPDMDMVEALDYVTRRKDAKRERREV